MFSENTVESSYKAQIDDFENKIMEYSEMIEKCLKKGESIVIKGNNDGSFTIYRQRWNKIQ